MERKPISLKRFSKHFKVGYYKLSEALNELEAPEVTFLSSELQTRLITHLRIVPPDSVHHYLEAGYLPVVELPNVFGLHRTAISEALDFICPDWRAFYPTMTYGTHRVALIPPDVVDTIQRLNTLAIERVTLAKWQKQRDNNNLKVATLPYQEDILTFTQNSPNLEQPDFDEVLKTRFSNPTAPKFTQLQKHISRSVVSMDLLGSSDILKLRQEDIEMLKHFINLGKLSLTYLQIVYFHTFIVGFFENRPLKDPFIRSQLHEGYLTIFNHLLEAVQGSESLLEFETYLSKMCIRWMLAQRKT